MSVIEINTVKYTGVMGTIRKVFDRIKNRVSEIYTGTIAFVQKTFGKFAGLFWLVMGILAISVVSPPIAFALGIYVGLIFVYLGIFFIIWNIFTDIFYAPAKF